MINKNEIKKALEETKIRAKELGLLDSFEESGLEDNVSLDILLKMFDNPAGNQIFSHDKTFHNHRAAEP